MPGGGKSERVCIGDRAVGPGTPTYVIAEIGSNHDGRLDRARTMIELAALCGADAVKFQSFTADGLVARCIVDPQGGPARDNPVHPILARFSVPGDWHAELVACAEAAGIHFLSAPFDLGRLALLDRLDVPAIKIASGDITFEPLLQAAARTGRPVLLSTGMSDLSEVGRAVATLQEAGCRQLVLFQCVSCYPTSLEQANVRAVKTLAEQFGCPVGLSDHSPGSAAALAAVALGVCAVEKHLTFDRNLPGPDHPFAMEPQEFRSMVREIRNVEAALGNGQKEPADEERSERLVGRRSLTLVRDLAAGHVLSADDLKCVRPGGGLSPYELRSVLGKRLVRKLTAEAVLTRDDVESPD